MTTWSPAAISAAHTAATAAAADFASDVARWQCDEDYFRAALPTVADDVLDAVAPYVAAAEAVDHLDVCRPCRERVTEALAPHLVAAGWRAPQSQADEIAERAEEVHAEHHPGVMVPSLDSCTEHTRAEYEALVRDPEGDPDA